MKAILVFGPFRLDTGERTLTRGGVVIPLSPKALDALRALLERAGHLVTRQELTEILWPDSFVADTTLTQNVWLVRNALGVRPDGTPWIETARRFGYRFSAPVSRLEPGRPSRRDERTSSYLAYGRRRIPLQEGENLIGRDPDLAAYVDSPTVSRRHAQLVISGGDATLEDLGSKNGTYLRTSKIERVVTLSDGDAIQVGSVELVFRTAGGRSSTRTLTSQTRPRG